MQCVQKIVVFLIFSCSLLECAVITASKRHQMKTVPGQATSTPNTRGLRCYNCLSFDHPGCWDPAHPDHANLTIPNIDCFIPGMTFHCIIITAESAKLVETGQEIGPVRARTCVPASNFTKRKVPYSMCNKLSLELSASEIFSRVHVVRPYCTLCKKDLCADAQHC